MKKEKKKFILKNKIVNSFMSNGQKETCEKIFVKTLKNLQRLNPKNYKNIIQLFIVNLTPTFKFNKQSRKKGKKKNIIYTPYLIPDNELRTNLALKLLRSTLLQNKKSEFSNCLTQEILAATLSDKSSSIEKKDEMQKQVLAQKRYFYRFRWYK